MSYISLRFQIMSFHKFFKTLFLLTFLFLTACQGFQFDPWPETQYGIHHTVQKGQTLSRIAQAYKIDMEVLRRANHIRDASARSGVISLNIIPSLGKSGISRMICFTDSMDGPFFI